MLYQPTAYPEPKIDRLLGESSRPILLEWVWDFVAEAMNYYLLAIASLLVVILFAHSLDYNFNCLWAG